MSGIEVTDRTQILVITSPEGRAGMSNAGGFDHGAVQLKAKLNECVGLIDPGGLQKLGSGPKNALQHREQALVGLAPGGQIEQAKYDSRRVNARRIIEISASPRS